MARPKHSSPRLVINITDEAQDKAVRSNSGGCLVADAMKDQYPQFTGIVVDMATIRFTDRKAGERYTYLTPPTAQHCLLSFDQGWPNAINEVVLRRAVKIDPVTRTSGSTATVLARRAARVPELEAKAAAGTITSREKTALSRMRKAGPPVERPTSRGPIDVKVVDHGSQHGAVIRGGAPLIQGPAHPNLLRGRNRHFGAKLADPGLAFREAVEQAVGERLGTPPAE
jgi:hypothetical protein